jgi:DNA sulfur modification protein DndD
MKFTEININNFRQYYGNVNIDLETGTNKNIILIGGRNGYGKTNLLLSIVWCLYGDKISQVDDNFKREIQKEKNYSLFMKQSINWTAQKENNNTFSTDLIISEIEFPEIKSITSKIDAIRIKREFNVSSMEEHLSISDIKTNKELFEDEIDKVNFINDYIIPLDAAKFVFFDAEKIGEIANLSIKEEGSFLNDALGKILGLDTYETLIEDLNDYANNLKKEGASKNLQEQIIDREQAIKIAKNEIEQFEEENAEHQKEIDELKKEIRIYQNSISLHSKQGNSTFDRESILDKINELRGKENELEERFGELSEIIPLAILTGKLEEISEHIEIQNKNDISISSLKENTLKIDSFIERLFNQPPEPLNSSMSLKDKMFYYDKAQTLGSELFAQENNIEELEFEHDLNNSEKKLIDDAVNLVNIQSKDLFETTIDEYNTVKIELNKLSKTLNKIDADLEDELILEYSSKKENSERKVADFHQTIGINKGTINKLQKDISRLNQQYQTLLKKVEINQQNRLKINKSNEYLQVLKAFVHEQKELKKESLAKNILAEMQKLMHKLNTNDNHFITDVKVTILAEGNGMKITLYNSEDLEVKKEILSQGEKQLYISSLIKAILKESIQSLPIFIDTPLGRLDDEHIKNILLYYYPDLSEQVVILSTNNEITPKRYNDISTNVSKAYLLVNDGINTTLKNGYFQGYEN